VRVLHFSDVHVGARIRKVALNGGVNLLLGRSKRFSEAREKLASLGGFARDESIDLVVFTGDYTALGLEREYLDARAAVEPLIASPLGYVNVPGNHDLYVPSVARHRRFEHHFGDTLESDLPEHRAQGPWPLVRLAGESVAVVAVNSSRPTPPFHSTGRIPPAQLEALRAVLADPALQGRFVFIATHYAPRLEDGEPDRRNHGLVEADRLLEICAERDRAALLFGHVHERFHVRVPGVRPPLFCAGSATLDGKEGLWVFDVSAESVRATPGRWDGERYVLDPAGSVEL
jgi:3',5'-cyclic AMP phosphodiesterase CpdA